MTQGLVCSTWSAGLKHLVCQPFFAFATWVLCLRPACGDVLKVCTIGISILAPVQVRWPIIAGDRLALCLSFCEIASCYFFALLVNHLLPRPCRSHRSQIGQLAAFTITTANLWDVLFKEAWFSSYTSSCNLWSWTIVSIQVAPRCWWQNPHTRNSCIQCIWVLTRTAGHGRMWQKPGSSQGTLTLNPSSRSVFSPWLVLPSFATSFVKACWQSSGGFNRRHVCNTVGVKKTETIGSLQPSSQPHQVIPCQPQCLRPRLYPWKAWWYTGFWTH